MLEKSIRAHLPDGVDFCIYSDNGTTPARVCIWSKDRKRVGAQSGKNMQDALKKALKEFKGVA